MADTGVQRFSFLAQHQPPYGPYFAVFEYLAHGTLARWIAANPQGIPLGVTLEIGYMLATALHYLHGYGLIHMDIKPRNIMLRRPFTSNGAGEAVLIDFGSARPAGEQEMVLDATFRASSYLAPEWIAAAHRGRTLARPEIDIYALGVLLYHLLTGQPPFRGDTPQALEASIAAGKWIPVSQVAQSLRHPIQPEMQRMFDALLQSALSVRADQRCTAGLLVERLVELRFRLQYLEGNESKDVLKPAAPPAEERQSRRRTATVALGILLFATGIGVGAVGAAWEGDGQIWLPTAPLVATPSMTSVATATLMPTATASATTAPTPTATATDLPTATPAPTATWTPEATPTVAVLSTLAPLNPTATRTANAP